MTTVRNRMTGFGICLLVVMCCISAAKAETSRLAVLEFGQDGNFSEHEVAFITDKVRALVLGEAPSQDVITKENLLVLLQAGSKKLESCQGECEVETGRLVGADWVISGTMLRFGSRIKVALRLHETREGRLRTASEASATDLEGLDDALASAVQTLSVPLSIPASSTPAGQTGPDAALDAGRMARLAVLSDPAGAEIVIDGTTQRFRTPYLFRLAPGAHQVEVVRGPLRKREMVSLKPGESKSVVLAIEAAAMGTIRVETSPSGLPVRVGGRLLGRSPILLDNIPIGEHAVEAGAPHLSRAVVVRSGEVSDVRFDPTAFRMEWFALRLGGGNYGGGGDIGLFTLVWKHFYWELLRASLFGGSTFVSQRVERDGTDARWREETSRYELLLGGFILGYPFRFGALGRHELRLGLGVLGGRIVGRQVGNKSCKLTSRTANDTVCRRPSINGLVLAPELVYVWRAKAGIALQTGLELHIYSGLGVEGIDSPALPAGGYPYPGVTLFLGFRT